MQVNSWLQQFDALLLYLGRGEERRRWSRGRFWRGVVRNQRTDYQRVGTRQGTGSVVDKMLTGAKDTGSKITDIETQHHH
jgi:hypothetical protein